MDILGLLKDSVPVLTEKHIWFLIFEKLDSQGFCRISSTCKAFYALTNSSSSSEKFWESCYARQKANITVVPQGCESDTWKSRFQQCKSVKDYIEEKACAHVKSISLLDEEEQQQEEEKEEKDLGRLFRDAVAKLEEGDTIVLTPGEYVVEEACHVDVPVHILGCGFNNDYTASSWKHQDEVPHFQPANIVLRSSEEEVLCWHANGGSISNVEIQFSAKDEDEYFFCFEMDSEVRCFFYAVIVKFIFL